MGGDYRSLSYCDTAKFPGLDALSLPMKGAGLKEDKTSRNPSDYCSRPPASRPKPLSGTRGLPALPSCCRGGCTTRDDVGAKAPKAEEA